MSAPPCPDHKRSFQVEPLPPMMCWHVRKCPSSSSSWVLLQNVQLNRNLRSAVCCFWHSLTWKVNLLWRQTTLTNRLHLYLFSVANYYIFLAFQTHPESSSSCNLIDADKTKPWARTQPNTWDRYVVTVGDRLKQTLSKSVIDFFSCLQEAYIALINNKKKSTCLTVCLNLFLLSLTKVFGRRLLILNKFKKNFKWKSR